MIMCGYFLADWIPQLDIYYPFSLSWLDEKVVMNDELTTFI